MAKRLLRSNACQTQVIFLFTVDAARNNLIEPSLILKLQQIEIERIVKDGWQALPHALSLFAVLGMLVLRYATFTQRVVVIPDRPKSSFDVENAEKIVKLQTSVEKPMVVTFDEIGIVTVRALNKKGIRLKEASLQAFVLNSLNGC